MVKGYPKNSVISVICVTIVTQEQRGGLGDAPEMCMWMTTCYASKTCLPLKRWQSNSMLIQIRIFPRVNQPLIHWKYLTRRSESMIDSLCPQKRNVAKIQPIVPEWISLDSFKNLDSKKWINSDSLWYNLLSVRKEVTNKSICKKYIVNIKQYYKCNI